MILAPIVFLQVPLRSSSDDLTARGNLTIIGAAMRRQKILHKISRTSTRRQDPPHAPTRFHALLRARFLLLTSALGDIIIATSSAGVTRQLADVIVDQDVDFDC